MRSALKRLARDGSICRSVLMVELALLLLVAVALTIAPTESLAVVAGIATWAAALASAYRPVVAFVGLLLVGGLSWSLIVLWQSRRGTGLVADEPADDKRDHLQRAA
jgi:hypothetical protein